MAIIVEEEKGASNLLNIVGWFVILVMLCAAGYYIFFVSPEAAIIPPSAALNNITPLSGIDTNVQSVLNTDEFQALKQYVSPTSTFGSVAVGRSDPFLSP